MVEKVEDSIIKQIKELDEQGLSQPDIAKKLSISQTTVSKYVRLPPVAQTNKPPETPPVKPAEQPQIAPVITHTELKPAPEQPQLYPEMLEPAEWLRQFLAAYRLKEVFIQAQCSRVRRRNQLPTPPDLMADLQNGDSGQKNVLMIRDIVEDYDFAVDDYMKQRQMVIQSPPFRRRGIPITP